MNYRNNRLHRFFPVNPCDLKCGSFDATPFTPRGSREERHCNITLRQSLNKPTAVLPFTLPCRPSYQLPRIPRFAMMAC